MALIAPRVSVIVPAYLSHERIGSALEALRAQTFRDFETIVVNSSQEDATRQAVAATLPDTLFLQSPERLLPHAARNHGVARAQGDLLVFTDPDCRARPDWLGRLVAAHDRGRPVVGGAMGLCGGGPLEPGVHLSKFFWLLEGLPAGPKPVICTANALYSRAAWETVGPFDGDLFTGDALLSLRAGAQGLTPWFEPRAVVEHHHDGTLGEYWREFLFRGREFGGARAELEGWSRPLTVAHLVSSPGLLPLALARAGSAAFRGGWGRRYLRSLPVQVACKLAWSLGEARADWDRVCGRSTRPGLRGRGAA